MILEQTYHSILSFIQKIVKLIVHVTKHTLPDDALCCRKRHFLNWSFSRNRGETFARTSSTFSCAWVAPLGFTVWLTVWFCVSNQLKTPSSPPSSTTPTAPQFTSNSRPLMSFTWPVAMSCRLLTGPTCRHPRGRTRSSPSSTRWWAWWRESSRLVTLLFKSVVVRCHIERNLTDHWHHLSVSCCH